MKIREKIKKLLLVTVLCTSLTACGGGGGPAVTAVSNFINNDVTNLAGSESIINSYSKLLSNFNFAITSGDISSLSGILTGPTAEDQTKAQSLLAMLNQAEALWNQTEELIADQDDSAQYQIYNSDSYKEAYAALLYLRDHVKPAITKVSQGQSLTSVEYNRIAKTEKAQEIIDEEKDGAASTYANNKLVKSTETISNNSSLSEDYAGTAEATTSTNDWITINAGGGQEQRTVTNTVPNYRRTVINIYNNIFIGCCSYSGSICGGCDCIFSVGIICNHILIT